VVRFEHGSRGGASGSALEIRVLGPLTVCWDGAVWALPASRKARALLAYLVVTQRPTSRVGLCDMFWGDGPANPRAELRWCLSKLRPILEACKTFHA
jgi:DNA-binding SARP family transcriptional activator